MSHRQLWIAAHVRPDAPWQQNFYPDDLPPEWRPIYLGNELPCVLLSGSNGEDNGPETLDGWLDAFETGLRAIVTEDANLADLAIPDEALLAKIAWDPVTANPLFKRTGRSPDTNLIAVLVDVDDIPDPARTRKLIETTLEIEPNASIALVFDGPAAMQHAQQARTVAAFMGW